MSTRLERTVRDQDTEHLSDWELAKIKRDFFEKRMDRLSESLKEAKTTEETERFERLREQTLRKVNKYRGSNFTS